MRPPKCVYFDCCIVVFKKMFTILLKRGKYDLAAILPVPLKSKHQK